MTINQVKPKPKTGRKPQYPDYILLDILDSVIKSGADPMEMIAQMKKALMERVMEAELNHHLEHAKNSKNIDGNYRNGYGSKTVLMDDGEIEINTPRDREGSFEPILVPKRSVHDIKIKAALKKVDKAIKTLITYSCKTLRNIGNEYSFITTTRKLLL